MKETSYFTCIIVANFNPSRILVCTEFKSVVWKGTVLTNVGYQMNVGIAISRELEQ